MAKAKEDPIIHIEHVDVPDTHVHLSAETAALFVDSDGSTPFIDADGNFISEISAAVEPAVIVVETQPMVRTESSGMKTSQILELAKRIAESGQIHPILVRPLWNTETSTIEYHLIAGLRRTLACLHIAETNPGFTINVTIRAVAAEDAFNLTLAENLDRENMTVQEIGSLVNAALAQTKGNASKAAEILHMDRLLVSQYKTINEACATSPELKSAWEGDMIGISAALLLVKLSEGDPAKIAEKLQQAFNIEVEKAQEQVKQIAAKAVAKGADPVKAVEAAKEKAASAVGRSSGASQSPLANAAAGKVSQASIAATVTDPKPKAMSGKQVADALVEEFGGPMYAPLVGQAMSLLGAAITGSGDLGQALRMLATLFDKKYISPEQVVVAGKKPGPVAVGKQAAPAAAPTLATPAPVKPKFSIGQALAAAKK